MEISSKNINNRSCRTCLEENIDPLVSIFEDTIKSIGGSDVNIRDVISKITSVEICPEENNLLPKHICHNCLNMLDISFKFRCQVKMVENQLSSFLQSDPVNHDLQFVQTELMVISTEIITEATDQTLDPFEEIPIDDVDKIESKDLSNICNFCKKTFCNEKYLQIHVSKQHKFLSSTTNPEFPYSCDHCDMIFSDLKEIQVHLLEHSESKSTQKVCPVCSKIFSGKIKLQKHLLTKHEIRSDIDVNRPYRCDICYEKSYTSFANLTLHKASHIGHKPHQCTTCQRAFYKKSSLISHNTIHTGIKNFLCNDCGRSFTSANILQQHKKTHTEIRKHICEVCTKGFHSSNDLRVHFRIHSGEKPFLCSECGKGFTRVTHLNIHLRTHTGEKPYDCKWCSKAFAQSGDLKSHMRIHTGEKPYICNVQGCNKRFIQSSGLTTHSKSHLGEKKFICDICAKKFTQASSLARHKKCHK